jgi:hypothetical protein
MATLEQLSAALVKADAAGNTADAKAFADAIRQMQAAPTTGIPIGRTASTQEGTMGAYTPRREVPKPGMFDFLSTPFEMGQTLAAKPRAEQAAFIAPTVEALGAASGGLMGAPLGPMGVIGGAGAGYAGAKGLMRLIGGTNTSETIPQTALRVGEDVGMGALQEVGGRAAISALGEGIKYAGPKIGKMVSGAANIVMPSGLKTAGLAEVLNNDPVLMGQVKTLLEQGKTIDQAAAIVGSPGLAAFAETARNATSATQMLYNDLAATLKATQTNQLAEAAANVNALTQRNLPVATASLTAPRRAVKRALAEETATLQGQKTAMTGQLTAEQQAAENALAAQRQGIEGSIANVSQLEIGQALAKANEKVLKNTQRTVTGPAYQAAFDAAPEATINLSSLAGVAKEQRGELLTQLKGLAPNSAALLERYGPKQVETIIQGVPVKQTIPPAPITLEEAHAIRQAINIDRATLKGSNESGANITRARLNELYDSLNTAINRDVSPEAKALFQDANTLFKERIVDVFRTGQPSNLTRTSTLNEPMLRPGDIVSKAMADEGSMLQFLKAFKQDASAMQNLKTGVEDLYRQQVLAGAKAATPEAHAKFMFDNAKQLSALDSAGLGMTTRLNQIGGQIKGVTAAEEALAAQGKEIPNKVAQAFKAEDEALNLASTTLGFKQTDKLRSAIIENPEVAGQALSRMDAPAKSSLARGVMQDAGKASDPLKHLTDNEQGIMRVLSANDSKTARATFNAAKDAAELLQVIEKTGNKLGATTPTNAMTVQKNLDNLTQNLPEVRAAVKDIQTQLAQGETFETLAAQGKLGKNSALKLFREETTPHIFPLNKVWSIANMVLGRLEGRIDKKLAVEIATELSNSATAAAAIGKAQAKQLAVGTTSKEAARILQTYANPSAVGQSTNALIGQ